MPYSHLSSQERNVITYLVLYDLSLREIARRLNRHHTTISRAIKRNRPTYSDDAEMGAVRAEHAEKGSRD